MLKGKVKKQSTRSLWTEIRDGFEVQVRHITRHELREMNDAAHEEKFDVKDQMVRRIRSEELFAQEIAKRIIGWRGLTGRVVRTLVEMDDAEYPPDEVEVPFSVEDAAELYLNSILFFARIDAVIYDLSVFERARRESLKNGLPPSPGGSSSSPVVDSAISPAVNA